jgi:WD40 repeat protein
MHYSIFSSIKKRYANRSDVISRSCGVAKDLYQQLLLSSANPIHPTSSSPLCSFLVHWEFGSLHPVVSDGRLCQRSPASDCQLSVLDAPGLEDDYYINALDWSPMDLLPIALGDGIHWWKWDTVGSQDCSEDITCIEWNPSGTKLAIGWEEGMTTPCKIDSAKGRIGALDWRDPFGVIAGSKAHPIQSHDIRGCQLAFEEVCGVKTSLDGRFIASGRKSGDSLGHSKFPTSMLNTLQLQRH